MQRAPSDLETKMTVVSLLMIALTVWLADQQAREVADELEAEYKLRLEAQEATRRREHQLDGALARIHELGNGEHEQPPAE